ncbi:MAG: hypothetical protein ABEJ93_04315 [Candidatus Nanohalobium sp.]
MRKQIAVFMVFIALSSICLAQNQPKKQFQVEKNIRGYEITDNSVFITSSNKLYRFSDKGNWSFKTDTHFSGNTVLTEERVIAGTRAPGQKLIQLGRNGSIMAKSKHEDWVGSISSYKTPYGRIFLSSSRGDAEAYNKKGQKVFDLENQLTPGRQGLSDRAVDLDSDGVREFFVTKGSKHFNENRFSVFDVYGHREWRTQKLETGDTGIHGAFSPEDGLLVYWTNKISKFNGTGNKLWEKEFSETISDIAVFSNSFAVASGREITRYSPEGEVLTKVKVRNKPENILSKTYNNTILAFDGENISSYSLKEGVYHGRQKVNGSMPRLMKYKNYNETRLATVDENRLNIYDISIETSVSKEEVELNSSAILVGRGKSALKAISLNKTLITAKNSKKVKNNIQSSRPVYSLSNINKEALNTSRPRWFVGDREKAVLVTGLAAKENASLTFDRDEADRDFSNYSMSELRSLFIEKFRPHHVVVADLDSDKGVLAAYMAVKQGVLPIDFDQEYEYPSVEETTGTSYDVDVGEVNRENGVYRLERNLSAVFNEIGTNRKTLFEGRYVSILNGARKIHLDPAERGLFDDMSDGNYFYSDLGYGDLDNDSRLEASVGRYPGKTWKASLAYHRSLRREKGEDALVASEYLQGRWPMVLATLGGGMWDGKNFYHILENEGFNTTHLVEQRSQPVMFIFDLLGMPTKLDVAVAGVKKGEDVLKKLIGSSAAAALKNAVMVVRGLSYAEQTLEIYLEHDWVDWQPLEDIHFPEGVSFSELKKLVRSFLPERYPEITSQRLEEELAGKDVVVYSGVGNRSAWIMANNVSGMLDKRYSGSNRLEPEDVPEMDRSIVWDSSNNAGSSNGRFKNAFLEQGATNYIGFSSTSYSSYNAEAAEEFLSRKGSVGESFRHAVNDLRSDSLIYAPETYYTYGIKRKLMKSLTLWGNPETVKDPLPEENVNKSRECSDNICEIEVTFRPEYRIMKSGDRKKAVFNTSDYLLRPGLPITPLYKYRRRLPENAEVIDYSHEAVYRNVSGLTPKNLVPVSYGGKAVNRSVNYTVFPEKTSRVNVSDKIELVQAAIQYREDSDKVLEKLRFSLKYRAPETVELEKKDRSIYARVNIEDGPAKLAYQINGSRTVMEMNRSGKVKLRELPPGRYSAKAFLYRDDLLSQDEKKFSVAKPLETVVFAPEVHEAEQRRFVAVVSNPNKFRIKRTFRPEFPGGVQLGFFENRSRTISLKAKESKQLEWRFNGVQEGNASIILGNNTEKLEVKSAYSFSQKVSPLGAFTRKGATLELTEDRSSEKLTRKAETPEGRILVSRTPSKETLRIVKPSLRIEKIETGEKEVFKVKKGDEKFRRVRKNGLIRTEGSIENLNKYRKILAQEVRKMLEHFDDSRQEVE